MRYQMGRTRFWRSLVICASLGAPLMGASVAQAALAGANPLSTTNRPDLRTVTLTGTGTAQYCFDQTISQVPSQTAFSLGGYSASSFIVSQNPTTIDATNNKCVDATFPVSIGDTGDLTQATIGQVGESAVLTTVGSGLVGNRADSTALSGSKTNNGTAGHTIAPDLTGVVVDNVNTGNTLDYIYDQQVQISSVVPADYVAYYQDGTALGAVSGVVAGGNVVKVTFSTALSSPVHGPTVIAAAKAGAVKSQTPDHKASSVDAAAVAGTSGTTTTLPDLQSTSLSTDGAFVDFTFDKPIAGPCTPASPTCVGGVAVLPAGAAGNFGVFDTEFGGTANCAVTATDHKGVAGPTNPCTANNTQLPNNVVRAYFDNSSFLDTRAFQEYLVKAFVTPGAVAAVAGGAGNPYGEAPIGDNQGAFAAAFTTAPDAFRVTFDNATNTATVLFDSRVFNTTPGQFVLLDANGTPLPGGTGVAAGPGATATTTPGPYLITVSFTGASVANAKALEIKGATSGASAVSSFYFDSSNVQQIVSPTGAAAILKAGSKLRFVRVALTRRQLVNHHRSTRHRRAHKR